MWRDDKQIWARITDYEKDYVGIPLIMQQDLGRESYKT